MSESYYVLTEKNNRFGMGTSEISLNADKYSEEELMDEINKELERRGINLCIVKYPR